MSNASNMSPNGSHGPNGQMGPGSFPFLYDEATPSRGSHLHKLIETLWKGKWILVGVVAVVVAAAAIYTYNIPTTYRTSNLLLVNRDAGSSSIVGQLSRSSSFSPYRSESRTLQNELLVLQQSMTIPNRVAERLIELETHPNSDRRIDLLYNVAGDRLPEQAVAYRVRGAIRAGAYGQEVDAIRIVSTGSDRYDVALAANLYAEEYIRRTKEKSRESLQASRGFLETQAEKLKTEVEAAEEKIENYMQREGAIGLDQEASRVVTDIAELEAQRRQLQIELSMARSSMDVIENELENIEPRLAERLSSSTEQVLSSVQEEKARLETRIEKIERENPNLPVGGTLRRDLRRMKERVAILQNRADSLAQEYVDGALTTGTATGES